MPRRSFTFRLHRLGVQHRVGLLLVTVMVLLNGAPIQSTRAAHPSAVPQQQGSSTTRTLSTNPAQIAFVPNAGQTNRAVRFQAQSGLGTLFFTPNAVTLALPATFQTTISATDDTTEHTRQPDGKGRTRRAFSLIQQRFIGTRPATKITGLEPLPGKVNYVIGSNPAGWKTNLSSFAAIQYRNLYPGIDLRYDGTDGQLKSTFLLQPGANPDRIRWRYRGADTIQIDPVSGDLHMTVLVRLSPAMQAELRAVQATTTITLTEHAPIAWQETASGRSDVPVRFDLTDNDTVRLVLGAYDPTLPLTIDPTISYAESFGGSQQETINDIAVHPDGSVVMTGWTSSTEMSGAQGPIGTTLGESYVLVSKRDGASSAALWTTYFGGNNESAGQAIAVRPDGDVVITGYTRSAAYPVVPNTLPACTNGNQQLIVAVLQASSGTLLANRCLGTSGNTSNGTGLAVAPAPTTQDPNAYTIWVAGTTSSGDFLSGLGGTRYSYGSATPPTANSQGFLVQLTPNLSSAQTRIYIGGSWGDFVYDLALDAQNRPAIAGRTSSTQTGGTNVLYPFTGNAYQSSSAGNPTLYPDGFVTQFTADGSALRYSTLLSTNNTEYVTSIAVADGDLYVTGYSSGDSFPVTPATAWQTSRLGNYFAFVTRLDPDASSAAASLVYSTLLDSSSANDRSYAIAARDNIAYVTGAAGAADFTIENPLGPFQGGSDLFVAALDTTTRSMPFSSFAGTENTDTGNAIALDTEGNVYVGGAVGGASGSNDAVFLMQVRFPEDRLPSQHTISYYESTVDTSTHRRQGCLARQRGVQGTVILGYGGPRIINGVAGVTNFSTPKTVYQVEQAVRAFAEGYSTPQTCSAVGVTIVAPGKAQLLIGVGTSNSGIRRPGLEKCDVETLQTLLVRNANITEAHGAQWAAMVVRLNYAFTQNAYINVRATGAFDAEPDWWQPYNDVANEQGCHERIDRFMQTEDWVRGYNSVPYRPQYIFFGSQEGGYRTSSWRETPNPTKQQVVERIFSLVQRADGKAQIFPQSYTWLYAREWYQLKYYARIQKRVPVEYAGVITQCGDAGCDFTKTKPWPEFSIGDPFENLLPRQGWQALYDTLNWTLAENYTVPAQFITTAPFIVPPEAAVTVPSTPGCNTLGSYSGGTVIPDGTCLPSGTIFPRDSSFSADFVFPAQLSPAPPWNRVTMTGSQELRGSTDICQSSDCPPRP